MAVVLWCVAEFSISANAQNDVIRLPVEPVAIETTRGQLVLQAEIADSDAARSRGLMFRKAMADNEAMLFFWPRPVEATMWMRNTYVSLDMLFVDAAGKVVYIERRTTPHSLKLITAGRKVSAVLELLAGTVERRGIALGDRLVHRFFRPG